MATRLIFLCAGATAAGRSGRFPSCGDPLDVSGARKAAAAVLRGGIPETILSGPDRAALATVAALGREATIEPRLANLDFGTWAGRTIGDVQGDAPDDLERWLASPARAVPGGEAMEELVARVGAVMAELATHPRSAALVVAAPAVLRGAIACALSAPADCVMHVDVAPLSTLVLSFNGRWRMQELARYEAPTRRITRFR